MTRLNSTFHPALTPEVLQKLFKRKIYTALSFIQTDPEVIVKITGVQYSRVKQIRSVILKKFSSSLVTGYKYYNEVINQCAMISSGIQNLDKLLDGGFITGNIYELCGAISSGKTQICMTIAVTLCHSFRHQSVLYVDTKNDISGHRIFEIIENRRERIENAGELMNRIKVCRVNKATELLAFLHQLILDLKNSDTNPRFRFVIIDSLSALFFRYLGEDRNEGLALLNNLANLLHYIAVEFHAVVLVTNLVTKWTEDFPAEDDDGGEEESGQTARTVETPALGRYWVHVPNTRINVKKLDSCEKWLLVVMKSGSQPIGKTAHVTIGKDGAS